MKSENLKIDDAMFGEDESCESYAVEVERDIDSIYESLYVHSFAIARLQQETRDLKIFSVVLTAIVCFMILFVYVVKHTAF